MNTKPKICALDGAYLNGGDFSLYQRREDEINKYRKELEVYTKNLAVFHEQ